MLSRTFCSGEAFSGVKTVKNHWAVPALPRTLLWELTALPRLLSWRGGTQCPSPDPTRPQRSASTLGPSSPWLQPFGPCTTAILCIFFRCANLATLELVLIKIRFFKQRRYYNKFPRTISIFQILFNINRTTFAATRLL